MAAYVLVDMEVRDPDRYAEYRAAAAPSVARYGGRYLVRGPEPVLLEGQWLVNRLILLEFPTLKQARDWYGSADYSAAKQKREGAASARMMLLEGYNPRLA